MARNVEEPTEREGSAAETEEGVARATATAGTPKAEAARRVQAQPEAAMAADAEAEGVLEAEEEFPWEKVLKWALTIAAITAVLYLIFRKKD